MKCWSQSPMSDDDEPKSHLLLWCCKRIVPLVIIIIFISIISSFSSGSNIITVTRPKSSPVNNYLRWKDEVIYQVYPRSFADTDKDGIGDLKGITEMASYLENLGIGGVWLNPIYPSPMADFGYDITNFTSIDPLFGTMEDFENLVDTFHGKGIKVVLDFVPNHSSDEHEWFIKSVQREEPYTYYYIWADPKTMNGAGQPIPPNNWLSSFGGSAWTWVEERQQFYYHSYLPQQPELNYRNPLVLREMLDALKFWLDKGVDGFRIDALKRLVEARDINQNEPLVNGRIQEAVEYHHLNHTLTVNQQENYELLRSWRRFMDTHYPNRILMAEVAGSIDQIMAYYGNVTHPLANFPFNFQMAKLRKRSDLTGESLKAIIELWQDNIKPWWKTSNWLLGSHDVRRVASRLGEDMVDAMHMLILLLPGMPVTYYGEEIGMTDGQISWEATQDPAGCRAGPEGYKQRSRDPERTPMQWSNFSHAGFSRSNTTWLPVNENYRTLNARSQMEAEESHLKLYRNLIGLRKAFPINNAGYSYALVNKDILSFLRKPLCRPTFLLKDRFFSKKKHLLVIINTSEKEVVVSLQEDPCLGYFFEKATVILRSSTDTSNGTMPGSVLPFNNFTMVGGGGLVLNLHEKETTQDSITTINQKPHLSMLDINNYQGQLEEPSPRGTPSWEELLFEPVTQPTHTFYQGSQSTREDSDDSDESSEDSRESPPNLKRVATVFKILNFVGRVL